MWRLHMLQCVLPCARILPSNLTPNTSYHTPHSMLDCIQVSTSVYRGHICSESVGPFGLLKQCLVLTTPAHFLCVCFARGRNTGF